MPPNDPTPRPSVEPFRIADLENDSTPTPSVPAADVSATLFRPGEFEDDPAALESGFFDPLSPQDPVAKARAEAQTLVAEARAEADRIRTEAREEGYRRGHAEAELQATEAADRFEALCREVAGHKQALYLEAREQVIELTLTLVEKLLGPLAAGASSTVVRTVERALTILSDREMVTLRVHPDDLKTVVDAKPQLVEAFDGIRTLTVVEDVAVHPGGCQVQTPTAEIDARLEAQLDELARAVRQVP